MTELAIDQSSSAERLLMNELTHRLNNEMTCLISIISLTAARSRNPEVKDALIQVRELLHHSSDLNQALQMPERLTSIDAEAYLRQLCDCLSRSKLNSMKIALVFEAHPLRMPADRCWRLGMIVYELITNAARHAFDGAGGEIRVNLLRSGCLVECKVLDNGSASVDIRPGRGLKIIEELVQGLGGRFFQEFGEQGSTSTIALHVPNEVTARKPIGHSEDDKTGTVRSIRSPRGASHPTAAGSRARPHDW
jgi:two-component sensor histidine kinase